MNLMRVVVVGLGVQGLKRRAVAGSDVVAIVDPVHPEASYKSIDQVPIDVYDAALLCVPDEPKLGLISYLLKNKKHLLVEKPLLAVDGEDLRELKAVADKAKVVCYTAYNHRFEPHFVHMKRLIDSGRLGRIYSVRLFYGNGTARLVRESAWRDSGAGVLTDLGSHLLDTTLFWFGKPEGELRIQSANCFENRAFDHVAFYSNSVPLLQFEVSLVSWRNHFYADIHGELGSAHISSLCKWGPSTITVFNRRLPSGRPDEESSTLVQLDPTWTLEYEYFKNLCDLGINNIDNDIWINESLQDLSNQLFKGMGSYAQT